MSLPTHLAIQKKQILKLFFYAIGAFVFCLVGTWLFSKGMPIETKLLISRFFGLGIFAIGFCGVILVSMSVVGKNEAGEKTKSS